MIPSGRQKLPRGGLADDFAHAGKVWSDAVKLLHASGSDPEARHDFIKDEKGVVAERYFPQEVKEVVLRKVESGIGRKGFQDDGGNVASMEFKGFFTASRSL